MGKLYAIGNAHIDPVWLWPWQEGLQEVKATFRSALDRMKENDAFVFAASSAAFYAWVKENDPALFDEIRARVADGRWEVVGGWWIEPDCNIPCGESFVRQALVGQRWLEEHLGVVARVGWSPDAFGHHAMLPQILVKSRLTEYVFLRPKPEEKPLPARLFLWESEDGSRVRAYRIPNEYCTPPEELEPHVRKCAADLDETFDELMCFYGVGNHGGGPTRANLAELARLSGRDGLPSIELSLPSRYFARIKERRLPLPVVQDELQHHARGCYSAHSGVKRWNRRAEHALLSAEKLTVLARAEAGAACGEDLGRAWRGVLFNQFHDILAGTSIAEAYEDARDLYGEATAIAARAENAAVQALAWRIGIREEEGAKPLVVINPHPWAVRAAVELEVGGMKDDHALYDDEGSVVAMQMVRSAATVTSWRGRVALVADLPPLGWRVYRFSRTGAARPPPPAPPEEGDRVVENDRFRLTVDVERGCIASLFDKKAGREVFGGPAARAVVVDDPSDTWAHGVSRFDRVVGELVGTRVRRVEHGPVKTVLRIESAFGASTLVQEVAIYADLARVDVRAVLDWREKRRILKLRFAARSKDSRATFEIPFGRIERRPTGEEQPGQAFVDLSDAAGGVVVVNDGKHGFDWVDGELGMTVARSAIVAHHDPFVPDPDGTYEHLDQGVQEIRYALLPHDGGFEASAAARCALEWNEPPVALFETYHDGPLPLRASFLEVSPPNVVVTAVKPAEDDPGAAFVVRAYESAGRATAASFVFARSGRRVDVRFGACEIKTLRVPYDPKRPVEDVDLLEWTP